MLPEFLLPRRPVRMDWPPKPPRTAPRRRWADWRALVGGTGRGMIGAGLLLFGFVGYQLWGTGIQQARSQDRLDDRFTELLDAASTVGPPTPPVTATAPASPATTTLTTATPVPSTGVPSTAARPAPKPGEPIAKIVIPSIGVDQVVVSGVGTEELKKGPGHYPDTPVPGQLGNAAIAGHRSTFGAPFERVDELDPGAEIDVITPDGRFVYRVTDIRVVEPTEIGVIGPTTDAVLTLTSCWPKYSADKRIVVRATLDPAAGRPAVAPTSSLPLVTSSPRPVSGTAGPDTTLAATTTVTTADTRADTTSGTTTGATAGATTGVDDPLDATASTDAFRQGWWSDEGAWGDVVLWGGLLTGVALAAWWTSRRTRRNWVGALAGIGPFVVALYFFYENAARLLPPNI